MGGQIYKNNPIYLIEVNECKEAQQMEILGILIIGGLILRALSGGGGIDAGSDSNQSYETKATSDWMRTTHLIDEQRRKEREEAKERRNGW